MGRILGREPAFMAISVFIAVILVTQFIVGIVNTGRWAWPMVAYPMYKTAHYDGERFDEYDLYAVLRDNSRIRIDPAELGMGYWIFRQNVLDGLLLDRVEPLSPIIARYCDQSRGATMRLEVSDRGLAISSHGLVANLEPQMLKVVHIRCKSGM